MGCKRPSSTATIRPLSSTSLNPPSSNKLTFVLRYLLSARSFFPNTPTHPETRLRLHRTRAAGKALRGGRGTAAAHRSGLPSRSAPHRLPSPVFTSPPKPTQQRNSRSCGQRARRCGSPPPPSARGLGGGCSAAHPALRGRFGPATGHPPRLREGCRRPAREGVWLARRGPAPAHLRG